MDTLIKWFCIFMGGLLAYIEPTIPFLVIATLAVAVDIITAWSLGRRIRKKHGALANDGKFKSVNLKSAGWSLVRIYMLIILAYCVEQVVFEAASLHLANIVSGAVCLAQIWSILENESSCNDSKWAKILQKIMVDKTERYLGIDLDGDGKIYKQHVVKHEDSKLDSIEVTQE